MKLLLTGGGTGGHVYPALAIAEALADEPAAQPLERLFIGSRERLEARLVPAAGIEIAFVASAPLQRRNPLAAAGTLARNALGIVQALAILHRFQPDVVAATGGYVSFPVVVAAAIARALRLSAVKVGLLEPNAAAGLTNRLLAPLADETWLGHAAGPPARAIVTGTPVRKALRCPMTQAQGRRALGLDEDRTTVVVFGGSQGARRLNEAVAHACLPPEWQVVLVTGSAAGHIPGNVRVFEYLEDPRAAYAAADIVVSRAGASTLAELAATGTPAILVPYPFAAGDHQTANARAAVATGAAKLVEDGDLDGRRLVAELADALAPQTLSALRSAARALARDDAARTIAHRILALNARVSAAPVTNRAHS